MEKSSLALAEQLVHLKKSLKNKRNSEIWEQSVQFYRNNQANLTSYHILKIIKITMKAIRSTITKNCRYLSKLAIRTTKRDEDPKLQEQIEEQLQFLRTKVKVLLNLLDCYTLAIQTVLVNSDPSYFNMMHRRDYHAYHPNKELIFVSAAFDNQTVLTIKMLEHEMGSYFHFVSQALTLYATTLLCCAENTSLLQFFKSVDLKMTPLWQNSCQFSTRKIEYQCVKLNFMVKNADAKLVLQHHIPLSIMHDLQKYHRKWEARQVKHYCRLLTRYLFLSFMNANNPHLNYRVSQFTANPHINAYTEIYIFMKELQRIYQFTNYKVPNIFNKYLLEFMAALTDSYQAKLEEMHVLKWLLSPYFQYAQLVSMEGAGNLAISPADEQVISILKLGHQEGNVKGKVQNRKSRMLTRQSQNFDCKPPHETNVGIRIRLDLIAVQMGDSIFNYIEESDEEESSETVHQFQQQRLREIREIQSRVHDNIMKTRRNHESTQSFMEKCQAESKLNSLHQKNNQLWSMAAWARSELNNKKGCESLGQKLHIIEEENSILQSPLAGINEYKPKNLVKINENKEQKPQPKWGETKLMSVQKKKQQPVTRKQQPAIFLSDKYDRMSRNLLLRSTRQSNKAF